LRLLTSSLLIVLADCDWLLWQLYRQAYRIDPADPEGVVTELEGACGEMRTTYKAGGAAAASSGG